VIIKILPNERGIPQSKLADAEIIFEEGVLTGLKLVGFGIWEGREGRHVTFPARPFMTNGERRTYSVLRPVAESGAQEPLRRLILQTYVEYQHQIAAQVAAPLMPTLPETNESRDPPDVGNSMNDTDVNVHAEVVAPNTCPLEEQAERGVG
jgi:hypothetical protein